LKLKFFSYFLLTLFFLSFSLSILPNIKGNITNTQNSIENLNTLNKDQNYNFTSTFFDSNYKDNIDTYNASIEFQNLNNMSKIDIYNITDCKFKENINPNNFTIQKGNLSYFNNISTLDNNYTTIESSEIDKSIANQPFDLINGSSNYLGNLEYQDNDFTTIESSEIDKSIANQPFDLINGSSNYLGNLEYQDDNFTTIESTEKYNYEATYSFENDIGLTGTDISFVDYDINTEASVIDSYQNHKSVMKYNSLVAWQPISHSISETSDSFELWVNLAQTDKIMNVRPYDQTASNGLVLEFRGNGQFSYYSYGSYHFISNYLSDTWYHIYITYDCSEDHFHLWLDGISMDGGSGYGYNGNPVEMDTFEVIAINDCEMYLDAIGLVSEGYTIGNNEHYYCNLIGNISIDLNDFSSFKGLKLDYSYKTSMSLTTNFSIYNYDTSIFDVISSNIQTEFSNISFNLNSSYAKKYSSSILRFELVSSSNNYSLSIDKLKIVSKSYINCNITIDISEFNNLNDLKFEYSFKTNSYQESNFSIYNYDTSVFDVIQSKYQLLFENLTFYLNSEYYSDNKLIVLKLSLMNYTKYFLEIDELKVVSKSYLDLILNFNNFESFYYSTQLISYQFTSINQSINLYIYNYSNSIWNLISVSNTKDLKKISWSNTSTFSNYISENNSIKIKYLSEGYNSFNLFIDLLEIIYFTPLTLTFETSFSEIGSYQYRYIYYYQNSTGSYNYTQEWIKFNVIFVPSIYLGVKIPYYVYLILTIIPLIVIIIYGKWYKNDKIKQIKGISLCSLSIVGLLLMALDTISLYLTIGNTSESSWIFTVLNALIFGVFTSIVGLNGKGIFKKTSVKGSTLFILVVLALSGFGYFGLLVVFNFPLNILFIYDIFSTSTSHGIKFFSSNILFFILIIFFSFLTESEIEN
jgi:hypothetical protein